VGPRVPAFALRVLLGEASSALLGSQRALPERPSALGFSWSFPELKAALADLVQPDAVAIEELGPGAGPEQAEPSAYLTRRRPRYVLRSKTTLESNQNDVFEFFSKPQNLGAMTPSTMAFQILGDAGPMRVGAQIDYSIRVGALPLRWRTTIESFRPATLFIDSQERGPYRAWWHEHRFQADGERTVMEDRVYYALPFGWLGRLVHRYFVSKTLVSIFQFRAHAVRLRFGAAACSRA
jgi:ligand-binding SRPBCC domain-containing protein